MGTNTTLNHCIYTETGIMSAKDFQASVGETVEVGGKFTAAAGAGIAGANLVVPLAFAPVAGPLVLIGLGGWALGNLTK